MAGEGKTSLYRNCNLQQDSTLVKSYTLASSPSLICLTKHRHVLTVWLRRQPLRISLTAAIIRG